MGYPEFYWVIAALAIVTVSTAIPRHRRSTADELKRYFECKKPAPDFAKLGRWMRTYVRVVAAQGVLQVSMLVVMARFGTGLYRHRPIVVPGSRA